MNKQVLPALLGLLLLGCHAPKQVAPTPPPATQMQTATPAAPGSLQAMLILIRHHWQLSNAMDAKGQRIDALFVRADKPLQLDFNASLVSVGNACNLMSAHHSQTGDSLTVDSFNSTMMACADKPLMALDVQVHQRLQGRLAMRISEGDTPQLVLVNAAGDVFTFRGVQTADARLGDPGEGSKAHTGAGGN